MLHIKHEETIRKLAHKNFKNKQDIEDAIQEAAIKLHDTDMSFVINDKAWVITVCSNLFQDLREKWTRMREYDKWAAFDSAIDEDCPMTLAEKDEELKSSLDLDEYLSLLPEKMQETAALYYKEDADYATIAALLNISIGTVASRLSNARSIIRGAYA